MYFQTRLLPDNLDLTQLCHTQPDDYPYALMSTVSVNGANSRYNVFFAYPQQSLALDHNNTLLNETGVTLEKKSGFLDGMECWWKSLRTEPESNPDNDLPFTGGWFVYLSYELAAEIEPRLQLPAAQKNLPIALAVRCPAAIIFDRP